MANLPVGSFLILRVAHSRNIMRIILISLFVVILSLADTAWSADEDCPPNPGSNCLTQAKIDLVFILDKSESVQGLGQTYNVMLEGIIRALDNPAIIPRDRSVAIAVITFNLSPDLVIPITEVNSEAVAADIIAEIKKLKCPEEGICATQGPLENTNYNAAIRLADLELNRVALNQPERKPSRRIMLLSSDGDPNIPDFGETESMKARQLAKSNGMSLELDAILVGIASSSYNFTDNEKRLSKITFRVPESAGEPFTFVIDAGDCNGSGASFGVNCSSQADEFAENTRKILRSDITIANLIVNTAADTAPNATAADSVVSLREAIERANSRGGKTIITFDESVKGKTISLHTPLPALTAPDITIDGIGKCGPDNCPSPSVTLDGSMIEVASGDGILIRSNHDTVRGLKIVNFKRAGVAIVPVCSCDNVGCNRIELNIFANNTKAGVLIFDPPSDQATAISHNVGNIISRNAISGSATPIDLGGDGATANDDRFDPDPGPNLLLNFPIIDSTLQTANGVSLKGKAASNQVIEIFKVTKTRTELGKPVIDAVEFVDDVTADMDGVFELSVSSTGFYTATATDPFISVFSCRNTSELTPIDVSCTAPAIAKITPDLEFISAIAGNESEKMQTEILDQTFNIENTGCARLVVNSVSIQRTESGIFSNKRKNDSSFFTVANALPITVFPGSENKQKFTVRFHPRIPAVKSNGAKLSSSDVLPNTFTSEIKIKHDGEGQDTIKLRARVGTAVQLINPNRDKPRLPALVTLTRSGDLLTITFSVFDSDLDVSTVDYRFFDGAGNIIPLNQPDHNLARAIEEHRPRLVTGQSFTVRQRFSNANQHPDVAKVEVTLTDGNTKVTAVSKPLVLAGVKLSSATARRATRPKKIAKALTDPCPSTALRLRSTEIQR